MVTFPWFGGIWNISRIRAPAKYIGTGGPGTSLVKRFTRR